MEGQWQKVAALLVIQTGKEEVVISPAELQRALGKPGGVNITIEFRDDIGIRLRIVDDVEAERLSREQGGLPA